MKKILLILLLLPFLGTAQNASDAKVVKYSDVAEEGMHFEHGLNWAQIKAKAKAENKYIVMDCFTTWCGPCKYMTANIFPLKETGDFYNDKYLAVKVQFDTTANDNEEVKAWFKDMEAINAQYKIRAYPTYLFFNPDGEAVHRAVGSSDAATFIAKGKDALIPEKQYYTQLHKYEAGKKDPEFLKDLAVIAQSAYDMDNANKVSAEYIASQTDLYTETNLKFIDKFTAKSKDKGFAMMMENPGKVNAVLGAGKAESKVMGIIIQEDVYPVILKRDTKEAPAPVPDFVALKEKLAAKYPGYAEEITAKSKVIYYQYKGKWNEFETEIVAYMGKYGSNANPGELNSYAWTVFSNCKDMTCVAEALDWSRKSFKDKDNPMYMDTYANILHKLGRTKEAIDVEEKALALLPETDKASRKSYQETLDKMKKGEKTWADEK